MWLIPVPKESAVSQDRIRQVDLTSPNDNFFFIFLRDQSNSPSAHTKRQSSYVIKKIAKPPAPSMPQWQPEESAKTVDANDPGHLCTGTSQPHHEILHTKSLITSLPVHRKPLELPGVREFVSNRGKKPSGPSVDNYRSVQISILIPPSRRELPPMEWEKNERENRRREKKKKNNTERLSRLLAESGRGVRGRMGRRASAPLMPSDEQLNCAKSNW